MVFEDFLELVDGFGVTLVRQVPDFKVELNVFQKRVVFREKGLLKKCFIFFIVKGEALSQILDILHAALVFRKAEVHFLLVTDDCSSRTVNRFQELHGTFDKSPPFTDNLLVAGSLTGKSGVEGGTGLVGVIRGNLHEHPLLGI